MRSCWTALVLSVALIVAVLTPSQTFVNGMVAGVDFGGEFFKIALVKPGTPFEIVTNVHSKRKTETMVAFDGEERLYGADALTVGVRRPQTAYSQLRRFLGAKIDDPSVVSLIKEEYFPYELLGDATRASVALKHNGEQLFHAEELVAMVFSHARQITDSFAEAKVSDWVITVPDFFSQAQRQAMLDAAEISGVRVLSLINENTAAALQLGVYTAFPDPKRILFYNLGSTSLQVSIVEFTSRVVPDGFKQNKTEVSFEVLAKAWDTNLGGSKFDLRLTDFLAMKFSKQIGQDVRELVRPMAKIRAQAKKTKIVLSANEEIPVVLQSLYQDTDFITKVTRKELEDMCSDLFERALDPVKEVLQKSGLQLQDIDDIEIIGGGVRMPKIQQLLKDFFVGKELGVHLNGDEAMALGAAFHGANLSNAFRVRNVPMTDLASYAVGMRLVDLTNDQTTSEDKSGHWVKRASLFTEKSKLGTRKSVAFSHAQDISCTFRYDKPSSLPAGVSSHIGKYNITGIEEFFAAQQESWVVGDQIPKVTISFELDSNGNVGIFKAEASLEEDYEVEVEVKKPKKKEDKKKEDKDKKKKKKKNDTKKKEEKEGEEEEQDKDDDDKQKEDEDSGGDQDTEDKEDSDKSKDAKDEEATQEAKEEVEPKQFVKEMRKRTHRKRLRVVHAISSYGESAMDASDLSILPMSVTVKKDSMRLLREMEAADNQRKANLEAKNKLEAFVYTARDKLSAKSDQLAKVTRPEQLERFESELEATEDWLYDEGEKVDAKEYNARHQKLESALNAMLFRVSELKDLPVAVSTAEEYLFSVREQMKEWESSMPQVTEDERKDVLEKVDDMDKWLADEQAKQKKHPAHEDPVLKSADVAKKMQGIKKLVNVLSKKPKPKPVEKPKEEGDDNDKDEAKSETATPTKDSDNTNTETTADKQDEDTAGAAAPEEEDQDSEEEHEEL